MTKEVFAQILGEVDVRYVERAGRRRPSVFRQPRRWAAAACLVLAALVGLRYLNQSLDRNLPLVITAPDGENQIVVNQADSLGSADLDVQYAFYSKLPHDVRVQAEASFANAVGISYEALTARIPEGWKQTSFYALLAPEPEEAGSEDRVYALHDYVLEYETAAGGSATIALSALEAPLRDWFILCEDPETSEINGVALTIYGYEDLYLTQFSYENVYWDIKTQGISLEELEALFSGLLDADSGEN